METTEHQKVENYSGCCTDYIRSLAADGENTPYRALMGPAHASSAMGLFMLFLGLFPTTVYYLAGGSDPLLMIGMALVFVGGAMIPDFDNTRAKIISIMGISGPIISTLFRESSRLIQSVIRTSKDDSTPNPHRGFWHSIAGALTLGLIVWSLSLITYGWDIDAIDRKLTVGYIVTFLVVASLIHVTLCVLGEKLLKKINKNAKLEELVSIVLSVVLTLVIFTFSGDGRDFRWVGWAVAGGMIAHVLGDALTKQGVPIFFPLPALIKSKRKAWWMTRFARFSADDELLNKAVAVWSVIASIAGLLLLLFHDQFREFVSGLF